jgi:hypothetical protein
LKLCLSVKKRRPKGTVATNLDLLNVVWCMVGQSKIRRRTSEDFKLLEILHPIGWWTQAPLFFQYCWAVHARGWGDLPHWGVSPYHWVCVIHVSLSHEYMYNHHLPLLSIRTHVTTYGDLYQLRGHTVIQISKTHCVKSHLCYMKHMIQYLSHMYDKINYVTIYSLYKHVLICDEPLPQAGSGGGGLGVNCCAKIISNKPFFMREQKLLENFPFFKNLCWRWTKMPKI